MGVPVLRRPCGPSSWPAVRPFPSRRRRLSPPLLEHPGHLGDADLVAPVVGATADPAGAQQPRRVRRSRCARAVRRGTPSLAARARAVTPRSPGSPGPGPGKLAAGSFSQSRMSRRVCPEGVLSMGSASVRPPHARAPTVSQPGRSRPRVGVPLSGTERAYDQGGRGVRPGAAGRAGPSPHGRARGGSAVAEPRRAGRGGEAARGALARQWFGAGGLVPGGSARAVAARAGRDDRSGSEKRPGPAPA